MEPIELEICAGSLEDCLKAEKGGAHRVELNSALFLGGLTPTTATLKKVKEQTGLEVICMARPRPGGFCYSPLEKEVLLAEAKELLDAGADGIAFGGLNPDFSLDEELVRDMVVLIRQYPGAKAVFHRAFDLHPNPKQAMQMLIDLGVDRVLTSGQKATAPKGAALLHDLQKEFGSQIEILAGSGIRPENAQAFLKASGIRQIHASCKTLQTDPTAAAGEISYGYLPSPNECAYEAADENAIRELADLLMHLQAED